MKKDLQSFNLSKIFFYFYYLCAFKNGKENSVQPFPFHRALTYCAPSYTCPKKSFVFFFIVTIWYRTYTFPQQDHILSFVVLIKYFRWRTMFLLIWQCLHDIPRNLHSQFKGILILHIEVSEPYMESSDSGGWLHSKRHFKTQVVCGSDRKTNHSRWWDLNKAIDSLSSVQPLTNWPTLIRGKIMDTDLNNALLTFRSKQSSCWSAVNHVSTGYSVKHPIYYKT